LMTRKEKDTKGGEKTLCLGQGAQLTTSTTSSLPKERENRLKFFKVALLGGDGWGGYTLFWKGGVLGAQKKRKGIDHEKRRREPILPKGSGVPVWGGRCSNKRKREERD